MTTPEFVIWTLSWVFLGWLWGMLTAVWIFTRVKVVERKGSEG